MSTGILFVSQIIPGKLLELSYEKLFWKKEVFLKNGFKEIFFMNLF